MPDPVPSLATVGDIARRLGEPVHRIVYVIKTRKLAPAGWAGNARVFREADVDYIASELRRLAAERGEP